MSKIRRIGKEGKIIGRDLVFRLEGNRPPQMGTKIAMMSSKDPESDKITIGQVRDIIGPVSCPWIVVGLSRRLSESRIQDNFFLSLPSKRRRFQKSKKKGKRIDQKMKSMRERHPHSKS